MTAIKPVTVDTVYEAVKSFIETNNILKQVIEDELCGGESIRSIIDAGTHYIIFDVYEFTRYSWDGAEYTYSMIPVSKEQLVKIINDFIA